jgi:hypothetical protein
MATVKAILSDICVEAQVRVLIGLLTSSPRQELWSGLKLSYRAFREVGLAADTPDSDVRVFANANTWC